MSLTGKLRFAYGQTETAAGVKGRGVGVTDGDWNIAAVEDLGGGLKAGANMALRLRGRDTATDGTYAVTSTSASNFTATSAAGAVAAGNVSTTTTSSVAANGARPRDASMYLTGGFGTVMVGAVEAGNGILGLVTAGGPNYIGLDNGDQLAKASNVDILQYTSPAMNGFSFKAATIDAVGGNGSEAGGAVTLFGASYANGPLSVALDSTSYGSAAAAAADKRTRISANYDLGVARVGFGMENNNRGLLADKKETAFSVSAPFGAFNVGMIYASSKVDGTPGNNTGYDFAVQYNLSKRTYLALQGQSTKLAGAASSATNTRVQLAHAF